MTTNNEALDGTIYSDGSYLSKHPSWHAERSPWKAAHVVRGLKATGLEPGSICDIGCGTGLALAEVRKAMPSVKRAVGFEPSPDAPLHPQARDLIEFRREDALASDDRFDCSIMLDVFEHVEDPYGFLRSAARLAEHHVFHIPLDANVVTLLKSGFDAPRRDVGHLHYFSDRSALSVLRHSGLEPIHWHLTPAAWDGPGREKMARQPINIARRLAFGVSPKYAHRLLGGVSMLVVARRAATN